MYERRQPTSIALMLRKRIVLTISNAGTSTIGERGQRRRAGPAAPTAEVHRRRDHAAGGGARHAGEVALVGGRRRLDVEAREAHRRGGDVDEARRPAEAAERPQAPGERQDRRRQPERHDVGERVELDAERRLTNWSAAR